MEKGRASRTALRVAHRRAVHQLLDRPCVLDDPMAIRLLGNEFVVDRERESHPIARAFRAFMAARSRFAEDELAAAVKKGITQYVLLGAGLDTFAYRSPFADLRVFEVDLPATQEWKRALLGGAGIVIPPSVTYVPLDFEHKTLERGLAEAGFEMRAPAFFGWLGVVPYLSLEAFRATISAIAKLPPPTAVTFDFAISPKLLGPRARIAFEMLSARVAAAGEPFKLFFTPQELEAELLGAGFQIVQMVGADDLNVRYFQGRSDGLVLSSPGLGMIAVAHK